MTDTETHHTEGPWEVRDDDLLTKVGPVDDDWNVAEVYVPDGHMSTPISDVPSDTNIAEKANARLIAAAPDLKKAAEEALDVLARLKASHPHLVGSDLLTKLDKALTKAEGTDA